MCSRIIDTRMRLFLIFSSAYFVLSVSAFAQTDAYDAEIDAYDTVFDKYSCTLLFDKETMKKLRSNSIVISGAWIQTKQLIENDTNKKGTTLIVKETLNTSNILAAQNESFAIIANRNRAAFVADPWLFLRHMNLHPAKRKSLENQSTIAKLILRQHDLSNSVLSFQFEIAYMQNDQEKMKESILQLISLVDSMVASGNNSCVSLYQSHSCAIKNAIRLKEKFPQFQCSIIDKYLCNSVETLRGLVRSFVIEARNEVIWVLAALEDADSSDEILELLLFYTNLLSDNEKFLDLAQGPIYDMNALIMENFSMEESVINILRASKNQVLLYRDLCFRIAGAVCLSKSFKRL